MYKAPTFVILFFLFTEPTLGQFGDVLFPSQNYSGIEKTYLQTDKDFYFLGDTIWYKAYLLDGQSLCPVSDIQNLHIELINSSGSIDMAQMLLCENGLASGRMIIPDTLTSGPFLLRGYTDYQRNFNEDLFFQKNLRIERMKNYFEIEAERSSYDQIKNKIDVSFFPEGGFLLAETENLVAFKAIDHTGLGIKVQGVVIDDSREAVVAFRSNYKGMGRFSFTPLKNRTYQVIIDAHPDFSYQFQDIRTETKKLVLLDQSREELILEVLSNTKRQSRKPSHVACFYRDSLIFHREVSHSGSMKFKIETDVLLPGVNRIVLLNENLDPISERLVFCNNLAINKLNIEPDENDYSTRSRVELNITETLHLQKASDINLTVSVVNRSSLLGGDHQQHLASYLLLDSELRGFVESPADFFVEEPHFPSKEKLDLLMLTHGWCNYHQNSLDSIRYPKTAGITIAGHAERLIGAKHLESGSVTMGLFTVNDRYFLEEEVDEYGQFSFDSLVFYDTASIFVQVLNEKGKKRSDIFLNDNKNPSPEVSISHLRAMNKAAEIPLEHYRQKFNSEQAFLNFQPAEGAVLLEEVEIVGNKIEKPVDDGHFRLYLQADQVIEVESYDEHLDILSYLFRKVNGLNVKQGKLNMRGIRRLNGDNSPLIVVDGIPISSRFETDTEGAMDVISSIPMSNVDKIEVLKGGSAVVYGSRGANGVIAIYTKTGEIPEAVESDVFGVITENVIGYCNHREIYSPSYTPDNRNNPRPDHRTTLYWNPEVTLNSDHSGKISFYTADDLDYYKILVEGITDDGRIFLGTADFIVDSHFSDN